MVESNSENGAFASGELVHIFPKQNKSTLRDFFIHANIVMTEDYIYNVW